jgi:hypothetical protein
MICDTPATASGELAASTGAVIVSGTVVGVSQDDGMVTADVPAPDRPYRMATRSPGTPDPRFSSR